MWRYQLLPNNRVVRCHRLHTLCILLSNWQWLSDSGWREWLWWGPTRPPIRSANSFSVGHFELLNWNWIWRLMENTLGLRHELASQHNSNNMFWGAQVDQDELFGPTQLAQIFYLTIMSIHSWGFSWFLFSVEFCQKNQQQECEQLCDLLMARGTNHLAIICAWESRRFD